MCNCYLRERKYKKTNTYLLVLFVIVSIYSVISGLKIGDTYAALQGVFALIMYTFPFMITRFLHFSIPQDCRLLYYIFTFCTVVVGSAMYGYHYIPYWDKILHFLSGILISAVGLVVCHCLFHSLSGNQKTIGILYTLFPFLLNLTIAALWEVYEYTLYIFLDIDAVNNLTTGVHDSMQDIIVCFVGGILFSISVMRAFRKKKYSFLLKVCMNFFDLRGQSLPFGKEKE